MQEQSEINNYGGVVKKDINEYALNDAIQKKYSDNNNITFYVNRFANDRILKADAGKYKKFIEKNQQLIGKNISFYDKNTYRGAYINNVVFHNDGIDLVSLNPRHNHYVIRHFIIGENNKFILDGVSVCDDTSQRNVTALKLNINQPTYFFKRPNDTKLSQEYDEYFSKNCFILHENIYKNDNSKEGKMKPEDFNYLKKQFQTISFGDYCSQRCNHDKDKAQNFQQSVLFDIKQVLNVCDSSVCQDTYDSLLETYRYSINEQVDKFIKDNEREIWQSSLLGTPPTDFFYPNYQINTKILSDKNIEDIKKAIEKQLDERIQYYEVDTQEREKMKNDIWNSLHYQFVNIINAKWILKTEQKQLQFFKNQHYIAAPLYQRNKNNAVMYDRHNNWRKKYNNKCNNRLGCYNLPYNNMLYHGYY